MQGKEYKLAKRLQILICKLISDCQIKVINENDMFMFRHTMHTSTMVKMAFNDQSLRSILALFAVAAMFLKIR